MDELDKRIAVTTLTKSQFLGVVKQVRIAAGRDVAVSHDYVLRLALAALTEKLAHQAAEKEAQNVTG